MMKAENQPKKIMKADYRIIQYCVLLALAVLGVQVSSAYAQGVFTNWNDLATNWVETSAPCGGGSIASSSDGTKLAAVANPGGIWTSTNAGVSWNQTSAPSECWTSIASSADGTKLAAVTGGADEALYGEGGIYTSTNGGVTWTQVSAPNRNWGSIASSSDGTKLAAVLYTAEGGWIYTSTDGGATWSQTSVAGAYGIAPSADGSKLAAIIGSPSTPGGIYTSINGGATWTQTNAPLAFWDSIASSADGTKLAAGVRGGGIYASTNGGVTWAQTSMSSERWWESIASSSDGAKLAAVDNDPGGIYTSVNGGVTWNGANAPDKEGLSIASSSDGTRLAAVVGYGIWTAQATIQTNPPSLTNIVVTSANPVIASGSNVTVTATGQFSHGSQTNLTSTNGQR
jgi:photosystem II stability/assembly factor-like uncharacterized protein